MCTIAKTVFFTTHIPSRKKVCIVFFIALNSCQFLHTQWTYKHFALPIPVYGLVKEENPFTFVQPISKNIPFESGEKGENNSFLDFL